MNEANVSGLPQPGAEEVKHSKHLTDLIRHEIADFGGWVEFSRYMDLALYCPQGGYYASGLLKFGEQGDFITAPEMGDLFARCLARQVVQIFDQLDSSDVLELGAGSGLLAAQIIEALHHSGRPVKWYGILEVSAELTHRQRDLLRRRVPEYIDRVHWLTELPERFKGVVLANEVVDALPVDRFVIRDNRLQGLGVTWRDNRFTDICYEAEGPKWEEFVGLGLADGYCSEAGFQAQAWMRSVSECLQSGAVIIIDYGFPASEYFHPQRTSGTLMCHYRHRSHPDPYAFVGLQDITAHVDFTALARCAQETGLSLLGFSTQASFLLSLGILDLVEPLMRDVTVETIKTSQQVKKLTLPSEMGELFKVMAVGAGVTVPLAGFTQFDQRHRL